jgi:hypothetical protein
MLLDLDKQKVSDHRPWQGKGVDLNVFGHITGLNPVSAARVIQSW